MPNCTHPNRLTPLPTNFGISAFGGFGLAFGGFTFQWAVSLPTVSQLAQMPSCDPAKSHKTNTWGKASMAVEAQFSLPPTVPLRHLALHVLSLLFCPTVKVGQFNLTLVRSLVSLCSCVRSRALFGTSSGVTR